MAIGDNSIFKRADTARNRTKLRDYEERVTLIAGTEQIEKIIDKKKEKIKDLVVKKLKEEKQSNWVRTVETNREDASLKENEIKIITTDRFIIIAEILDNGEIIFKEEGIDDEEPYPTLQLEQLSLEGTKGEKIKIKVTAQVDVTDKTKKVESITLVNTGEEKKYTQDGVIFEVEENGTYVFKAITDYKKSRSKKIYINIQGTDNKITIAANPTTARNTENVGSKNGIETGPVKVTINYEETNLQKQYKKEGDSNWINVDGNNITLDVTENIAIIARYYDGTNGFQAETYNIQNVDNVVPNTFNVSATSTTNSITASASATDTASSGATSGIAGILRYEYRINSGTWQTSNEFKNLTTGTYTVQAKAIDKAGNERISTNTASITLETVPTEDISITATPTTARNTGTAGIQNGIAKGPISVTVSFGNSNYTRQYKVGSGNWTTVSKESVTFTVTANTAIVARYYDGTNGFETETYNIQNVDNVAPTFSSYNATVSGATITATGAATDTASSGAASGIPGILRYEYSINGSSYQTSNTFTVTTAGNYTVYIKAIDKAGNQTVVTKAVSVSNYTVTYNANGGSGASSAQSAVYGTKITLSSTKPSKTGYTFLGWSTGSTATSASYVAGASYTITGNVTLYAVWSANTNTAYKVVHQQMNVNGIGYTTVLTEQLTGTTGASVSPAVKSYTGFKSPSTQKVTIAADGSTTVTYQYTRSKYTFTLGSGTGVSTSGSSASGNYYYGATITLKATASTGYTFSKWTSSNTSLVANKTTASTTFAMPAGAITMTPSVTAITYTVKYNGNGNTGGSTASSTHTYNTEKVLTANGFTKTGYTFKGWATSSSGSVAYTDKASVKNLTTTSGGTVNLYAVWELTKVYLLSGSNLYESRTGGWSTAISCSNPYCTANKSYCQAITTNAQMSTGYKGDYATVCTVNKINLTNYNKIYFTYDIWNNNESQVKLCEYYIGISSDNGNNNVFTKKVQITDERFEYFTTTEDGKGTSYIDVSGYTGSYYVKIYTKHTTDVMWYNYWAKTTQIYLTY